MPEKPKTKAELCGELHGSKVTFERFLRALCSAVKITLNANPVESKEPFTPRRLASLLSSNLQPHLRGKRLRFKFDDLSFLELKVEKHQEVTCKVWTMHREINDAMQENVESFFDFLADRKRQRP
jgi:hypothetical protein